MKKLLFAAALLASTVASAQNYTVQAGDTLENLSARFKTTPASILNANGIMNPYTIMTPGNRIYIPAGIVVDRPQMVTVPKSFYVTINYEPNTYTPNWVPVTVHK